MSSSRTLFSIVSSVLICGLIGWKALNWRSGSGSLQFPNQPIQVVVPYSAGGGTDTFVRIIEKSIAANEKFTQPFVILNQPGGGSTIGGRYVMGSRPDGYRLLCNNDALIAAQLAGIANFGYEELTQVAQLGTMSLVLIVREDSPYQGLRSLLEAANENPNSVRFGADIGSPAYFYAKELEETSPGSRFNYISTGGGQKRYSHILGGHLDVGIFSVGEFVGYRSPEGTPKDQNIKAIAILTAERNPGVPEVPTATEQGFAIDNGNSYYWFAPKGTPQAAVDKLREILYAARQDPTVAAELKKLSITPDYRVGEELERYLQVKKESLKRFAVSPPSGLPDFPAWIIGIVLCLAALVFLKYGRNHIKTSDTDSENSKLAILIVAILLTYIICLQLGVSYVYATIPAIFLIGINLAEWNKQKLLPVAQLSILFSLGSEFVFTVIFSVPLP